MFDNDAQQPDSDDPRQEALRRRLPVGARFPRSWPGSSSRSVAVNARRAYQPPVGCRFQRAGQVVYREPVDSGIRPIPGPPVGARFPRSSAWHSETLMESTLFV